ncbi:hypothetical protein [Paraconexibacter algicola]|uniref:Uncharacterized protein n=1 Tax=Paraconexibacter algicola TaxID=2133960 RepID=A0A2T4UHE4_9ACTN|nr:hypothetical protein [Paraconexibacter algicola]PTL58666.1 hypothetical protein C7Y72_02860 [Paraconexibacter algicola]
MSTPNAYAAWSFGTFVPPGAARAQDGSRMRITPNPAVPVPAVIATPLLAIQMAPWPKPSASACFPLHPLGSLELYERARTLLAATGQLAALSPEQLSDCETAVWRYTAKLFKPGHPIRSRLDEAVENRWFQLREEDARDPYTAQPAHLAAWVVLQAALDWAREASP